MEKKRRWKASDATPTDSSVITVSVTEHKQEQHIEIHENDERPERQSSLASDYKEELSDTKDKMEELDYEEPMQSSVAEVAEEVKVRNSGPGVCLRGRLYVFANVQTESFWQLVVLH